MDFDFRIAIQQDLPEVCQLFLDAIKHMNSQNIPQWDEIYPNRQTLFDDIQKQQMYLLTENDTVVSVVVLNAEQDAEYQTGNWRHAGGKFAVIHRLCVKASNQNKGLGRRTMLIAEHELLRQGYDSVRLDAFSLNPFSQKLYESIGYQKTGEVTFRKGQFYLYEKLL